MKSNPNVYPHQPFRRLRVASPTSTFKGAKQVELAALKRLLTYHPAPRIVPTGRTVHEKLLSIFLHPNIRFGPREYITSCRKEWFEKMDTFIQRKIPIEFTILGFPFKTPVPLKTGRHLPDMGEVLALHQLYHLGKLIQRVYKPGARITVFAESPFAPFAGLALSEAVQYRSQLQRLNRIFGFNSVVSIVDLGVLEQLVPNFKKELKVRIKTFQLYYRKRDPEFMAKYESAFAAVFRIMNARAYRAEDLVAVYGERKNVLLSKAQVHIRAALTKKTNAALFSYFAYLKVRDDFKLIGQYRPGALSLTVSPKPHRLGIHPIGSKFMILHTHGVPVFDKVKKQFRIEYLFDIERNGLIYTPVYLKGDSDHAPFYYQRS